MCPLDTFFNLDYFTIDMISDDGFLFFGFCTFTGTRADELSLAENGVAGHSRSGSHGGSVGSSKSDRLAGFEGDETQHIVGEPADEGLIAGADDDILYPEVSLISFSQGRCNPHIFGMHL